MRGTQKVDAIVAEHGHVDIRRHRSLRTTIGRLLLAGAMVRILPAIYIRAADRGCLPVLLGALFAWAPEAVLIGDSARAVARNDTPALPLTVALASTRKPPRWIRITRQTLPAESIRHRDGLRFANPTWLAIDAAATDQGQELFDALRENRGTLHDLVPTLRRFRGANGNATRNRIVAESARNPHSYAEHQLQQLLLRNGIDAWIANRPIRTDDITDVVDIYLPEQRVALEFDSWEHHSSRDAFDRDRAKQLRLAARGILTLRITWRMLTDTPADLVRLVKAAIRACSVITE